MNRGLKVECPAGETGDDGGFRGLGGGDGEGDVVPVFAGGV